MTTVRLTASPGQRPTCTNADTNEPIKGVRDATIHVGPRGDARIVLAVAHGEIDITSSNVTWTGLERVPTEALRAELDRRKDQNTEGGLTIPTEG